MLPLTVGFLLAGPLSGILSDRYGSRPFATGGMLGSALSFVLLERLPVDFSYPGLRGDPPADGALDGRLRLAEPGRRDEQPARAAPGSRRRHEPDLPELRPGALDRHLLHADDRRAVRNAAALARRRAAAHGVPATATHVSDLPPVSVLFAAFLGYNPAQKLIGPHVLARLPAHDAAVILAGAASSPT